MTYFNPAIFNKENLKEKDRKELEYYEDVFKNVIANTEFDYCANDDFGGNSPTMKNMLSEVIHSFCEALRTDLGYAMQEQVVAMIDSYDEDVPEREEYTTFIGGDKEGKE